MGSNPISSTKSQKCLRPGPSQHGELLHKSRMAVFPRHTRANECCQLAGHAASRVVPGTVPLENLEISDGTGVIFPS